MKRYISSIWPTKVLAQAIFIVVAGLFVAVTPVSAQSKVPLAAELIAKKVLVVDGKETFAPGDKARPGDTIEYTASYKNNTKGSIKGLKPSLPIPEGMEFLANSAKPMPSEGSLDGKKFEAFPVKRKFKTVDGKEEEREVAASQIRALRWNVNSLAGGATTNMVARVRVSGEK